MSENIFALEYQADQKRREARAEVRRDRIGADLARQARPVAQPSWRRSGANFFAAIIPFRRPAARDHAVDTTDVATTPG